jgi:hypothetical protein
VDGRVGGVAFCRPAAKQRRPPSKAARRHRRNAACETDLSRGPRGRVCNEGCHVRWGAWIWVQFRGKGGLAIIGRREAMQGHCRRCTKLLDPQNRRVMPNPHLPRGGWTPQTALLQQRRRPTASPRQQEAAPREGGRRRPTRPRQRRASLPSLRGALREKQRPPAQRGSPQKAMSRWAPPAH